MARPRSRSASSKLAAATSATPPSGCDTGGTARGAAAIAAAETNVEFMRDIQESGNGVNRRGALSRPRSAQTRPGLPLPLVEADRVLATFRLGDGPRVSMRWACAPGALCIAPIALIMAQRLA